MILVVGASGNIGKHVVARLNEQGLAVRAVSRDPERAKQLLPVGVEIVAGDLTNADAVTRVLQGVDKVYLATNGADFYDAETNLIRGAQAASIRHIVKVSVIGASFDNFVVLAQAHAAIEQQLAASGIPATLLRPNWFMENFFGSASTIIQQGAIYGSADEGKVAFIDSRDTAAVAVAALTVSGHEGKEYQLSGPEALTFAEAAQRIGQGLGRDIHYVNLPEQDFQQALIGGGVPAEFTDIFLQINRNAREGNLSKVTDTVATLTGQSARTLEAFAHDYAGMFTAAS